MLGDLRLKDLKISVKEYQELNKNASAMQIAMVLTDSEEFEEIFNPFLNRFADDELYQVFYLLCRYIDECYEMGVNDYVTKPIIPARIRSSVESHMKNIRNEENEPRAEHHQLKKAQPASLIEMDPAKYIG